MPKPLSVKGRKVSAVCAMDCRYPQEPSRWEQCWKMASEVTQVFAKSWFGVGVELMQRSIK